MAEDVGLPYNKENEEKIGKISEKQIKTSKKQEK